MVCDRFCTLFFHFSQFGTHWFSVHFINNITHSASPFSPPSPSLNHTANLTHHPVPSLVTIPSPFSSILPIKAASGNHWVRNFCEEWCFIDLSLLSRSMDGDKCAHSHWFLIAQTQKIGMSLAVASEDDTSDQNGKPSTPPHLTSSTSTFITTRQNLHLTIILVLRMYYLPRDQQFCLVLSRPAFFPVHFCIFEFEYVQVCVSIFHLFVICSS